MIVLQWNRRERLSRVTIVTSFILCVALVNGCREAPHARKPLVACPAIPADGMRLWLRADAGLEKDEGGRIQRWRDQSPEHNDFSQAAPAKRPAPAISRGRDVVRFSERTASLFCNTLTGPMDELTIAIVMTPAEFDGNSQYFGARDWSQFLFHAGPNGVLFTGTSLGTRMDTDGALPKGLLVKQNRVRFVFVRRGGTATFFKDGSELASRPSDPPAPWTGFQIGHDDDVSVFRGDVAEMLVYRRALSPEELAQVDTYLRMKYWDLPGCVSPPLPGTAP